MARPPKQGLDYFAYDIDLDRDDKLELIVHEFGIKGELLYTKLLCWIYKHEGYYTEWDEVVQLRFLGRYKYCGFSLGFMNEVVPKFRKWGLFDEKKFTTFQILTSNRVQENWYLASRKRNRRNYDPKYWLKPVNGAGETEETQFIPEVIDKGKETKENEIKGEVLAPAAPPTDNSVPPDDFKKDLPGKKNAGSKKFIPPDLQEVKDYFAKVIGNPKKPGHWPADKCSNEAGKFHDHYKANGWKQGKGKPIVDWQAACHNWIRNEREGQFPSPAKSFETKPAAAAPVPVLSKIQTEVNYLYDSFCEDPTKVTIISVDPLHYDEAKKAGLINFAEEKIQEIKVAVKKYLAEQKIQVNEQTLLKNMKRFGLLEFFKDYSKRGIEAIFTI